MDKSNHPLVSIVFTSYNHKEYLKQALDCIVNQNYPNLEIIIIDDCSSDGSQEILKEYQHFENVNLKLQTKNSGSYVKASNLGASFANGDYLLFAQCDDFADLDQIKILLENVQKYPSAGVAFSTSMMIDSQGKYIANDLKLRSLEFKKYVEKYKIIPSKRMIRFLSSSCVIPNLSAAIIKKDIFQEIGGLSEKYTMASDWLLWLEAAQLTDFVYVKIPLNNFRQHDDTIRSNTKITSQLFEISSMFAYYSKKYKFSQKELVFFRAGFWEIYFNYMIEFPISSLSFIFSFAKKSPLYFIKTLVFIPLGAFNKLKNIIFN